MRISFDRAVSQRAFTLVEVLVVMLIIGLSLSVLFRLDYSAGPRQLDNEARKFAGSAGVILEEAVLSGDYWGIDFFTEVGAGGSVNGYRWLQLQDDVWQPGTPAGMDDFPESILLDAGLDIRIEIEGLEAGLERKVNLDNPDRIPAEFSPDVWLFPDHESTAFTAHFSHREYGSLLVEADILGRFRIREP